VSAEIINLRRARKAKARAEAQTSAAENPAIMMQPHAPPAIICPAIKAARLCASMLSAAPAAPTSAPAAITGSVPKRLASAAPGNIATLKPIQNSGSRYSSSPGVEKRRYCGAELSAV